MKEIFSASSLNGRWAVVGPGGTTIHAQGSLSHIGKVSGTEAYEFVLGETGTAGNVTVRDGETLVTIMDLHSYQVEIQPRSADGIEFSAELVKQQGVKISEEI